MGMSTYVKGVVPGDEKWKKAMEAWYACRAAKVEPPDELYETLGLEHEHQDPDPNGKIVDIRCQKYQDRDHDNDVVEVHLDQLPKDVVSIRFIMSY